MRTETKRIRNEVRLKIGMNIASSAAMQTPIPQHVLICILLLLPCRCSSEPTEVSPPIPVPRDCLSTTTTLISDNVSDNILVDAHSVYWSGFNMGIYSADKTGGSPQTLVAGDASIRHRRLGMDDTTIYWVEQKTGRIQSIPKQGGSPTFIAENVGSPADMAVDESHLYWSDYQSGEIERVKKDGTGLQLVTKGQWDPLLLAVDDVHVFFRTLDGRLMRVEKEGGEAVEIANEGDWGNGGLGGLAVDEKSVVWGEYNNRQVVLWDKQTNNRIVVAEGQRAPTSVALDGEYVFWTNMDPVLGKHADTIGRAHRDGSDLHYVVCDLDAPNSLFVEGGSIYWTDTVSLFTLDFPGQ